MALYMALMVTITALAFVAEWGYQLFQKKRKPIVRKKEYFSSVEKALNYAKTFLSNPSNKTNAYIAVIYLPNDHVTDFAESAWPPKNLKKNVCPRILLVSTWTNGKLSLPGGKVRSNRGETAPQAIVREFKEEVGSDIGPIESIEYVYSSVTDKQVNHYYCKVINEENEFTDHLKEFHTDMKRKGYIDEIFGSLSIPIWIEGPSDTSKITWESNTWGLPRFLTSSVFRDRDEMIIFLLKMKIIDVGTMSRVFALVNTLDRQYREESVSKYIQYLVGQLRGEDNLNLPTFEEFRTRISDLLN